MQTITVPFHGNALYVVNGNGEPYTPMKPIVEGMGMDWKSQRTKIKQRVAKGGVEITIPTSGGPQKKIKVLIKEAQLLLAEAMSNIPAPECFCWRVADAYMYYLMATNRRPVYRYQAGDIEVCRYFLCGFLDDHLSKISPPKRAAFCLRLLEPFTLAPDPRAIICEGKAPMLNRRGVRYMNALMHQYGDTLMDVGVKDERGMLVLPPESEWASLKFSRCLFE